jgi:4-diphosphocytidyl-2-C-methyl-D-erythritol kinase
MNRVILDSPAKINLYLKVLGTRPDGYHQVETVIETVDIYDRLSLTDLKDGLSLSSDSKDLPPPEDNLAYKAASLLIRELGIKKGVHIFIKKRIPIAAGLGGGSSNAASVVLGLNRLWNLKLNRKTLLEFGKKLGADVPFFISGYRTALATGRGDEISPLKIDSVRWYCVVMPTGKISSKKIYDKLEAMKVQGRGLTFVYGDVKMLIQILKEGYRKEIEKFLCNGLTEAVVEELPVVGEIIELIESMGLKAVVSGSGPAVYMLAPNRKEAIRVAREISTNRKRWTTYVTQTYNRRKQSGNNRG